MLNPFKKSRTTYNNSSVHKQVERLRTPRYELDDSHTSESQPGIVVTWWTRLLSAVVSGDIANQDEQYLAHQRSWAGCLGCTFSTFNRCLLAACWR